MRENVRIRQTKLGLWVVEVYFPSKNPHWTVEGIWKTKYKALLDAALWSLPNGGNHENHS